MGMHAIFYLPVHIYRKKYLKFSRYPIITDHLIDKHFCIASKLSRPILFWSTLWHLSSSQIILSY